MRAWLARVLSFAVVFALLPRAAHASGFATLGVAPDHATAVTTTPVASYTNPAALRAMTGLHLFLDSGIGIHAARYVRASSDVPEPADAKGANTGEAKIFDMLAAPTLSAAYSLRDWSFGLGYFAPFGGAASWQKNDRFKGNLKYPGAVDSPARWHAAEGLWVTAYFTGSVAYQIPHTGLSFGASANAIYSRLDLTQAFTASLDDDAANEGRFNFRVKGWQGSFGLGTHWEVIEKVLWLGLSYQAPPGLWKGVEMSGPVRTSLAGSKVSQNVRLEQKFPDIIQAGVRYRPQPSWELRLSGNWQRFSAVRSQCFSKGSKHCHVGDDGLVAPNSGAFANIVRRWHDAFGARLAASYFFDASPEIFGAVSWDGSAVPNSTLEPGMIDGNDLAGTLGSRFALPHSLWLAFSYTHQYMLPRDNRGESKLASFAPPNRVPSANGKYEQWVGILNVNLEARY